MSNTMRQLLDKIETRNIYNTLNDPQERQAAYLRSKFFKQYIIKRSTNSYSKKVERDFAYIALREYRYEVQLNSFINSLGLTAFLFFVGGMKYKKTTLMPLIGFLSYFGFEKYNMVKYNKRLFDMCNVGEDTELGYQRNKVLRECNKILNTEDF